MSVWKRFHYNAPVILTFTLASLVVLLLGMATDGVTTRLLFSTYRAPFSDPLTYVRLFGHGFGHADVQHFFGNFILILLIGPILEEKYGSLKLLFMMLFTAVITGLINMLFFNTILLGASGIAFMFIVLSSFVNLQSRRIPLTFVLVVAIFVGNEVVQGINPADNVSHLTHIAGGLCGAVMGYLMNRPKKEKAAKTPEPLPEAPKMPIVTESDKKTEDEEVKQETE